MMRNRSFTSGAKMILAVVIVVLIAAVLVASLLGFAKSKETSGYTAYSATLSVAQDSETFDFDALRDSAAKLLGDDAEITFETSMSSGNAIMNVIYIPAPEKSVDTAALAKMITEDFSDAGEEITFREAVYEPAITGVDYGIYGVSFAFVLILAFVLLCVFFSYRNALSAGFAVLAALVNALLVVGVHALVRLPAGRAMLTSAAIALVTSLFANFFLMASLGNTRMTVKKFSREDADEILYAGYRRHFQIAVIMAILLGSFIATALILEATGLALYFVSCLIGLFVPLFTSVFLFSAGFGARISSAKTTKK